MNMKDKALCGGLTYKIIIDLIVLIGLLFSEYTPVKMFLMVNFVIKISIDLFAIFRIANISRKKGSDLNG